MAGLLGLSVFNNNSEACLCLPGLASYLCYVTVGPDDCDDDDARFYNHTNPLLCSLLDPFGGLLS